MERLTAYNGWNTADNTVGFAICQGILIPQMSKPCVSEVIHDGCSATAFLESKNQKNAVYLLGGLSQKPVHDLALRVCRDLSGRYNF